MRSASSSGSAALEAVGPAAGSRDPAHAPALIRALEDNVARVVKGKREVIQMSVVALLAGGHVLIEDVPGVGKTTLAQALARSLGLDFQRIQFTSDLLPSDILGVSIYHPEDREFRFSPGPVFANIVLADEINRATPKSQSALLEAMAEGQVSIDRTSYALPRPFLVLATQNPLEHQGTFPLPESQLDRFLMALELGYPSHRDERDLLLSGGVEGVLAGLEPVIDGAQLLALQAQVASVRVAEKLADYMLTIAKETRESSELRLGVSTRGLQGLYRATQALAFLQGRDYAIPDDVQRLAKPILAHRIVVRHRGAESNRATIVDRLVRGIPVPV